MIFPPDDYLLKATKLQRWQRNWINDHRSINYSGLCQELVCRIIKEQDPEYYEKYKKYLDLNHTKKKEVIDAIAQRINL